MGQSLELARWALRAAGVKPAEMVNQPSFAIGEAARRAAEEFWVTHGLAGKRVVVLQPGAGAVLKSWPIEHWAQLAEAIVKEETSVVLAGAPADLSILREIEERVTSATIVIACGQPLDVSAAIYARCALLVGPDSGAAHLAAAMGTPTVRLYGPAPPDTFGPWPPHGDQRVLVTRDLPCVPCGHLESPPCGATTLPACMLALSVADVLKAVRAQMGQG